MKYDFLIVGAGLFGSVCASLLKEKYKVLVIDKRDHIGGNCYTYKNGDGIIIHKYGPHIFHTNNFSTWNFVKQYTDFNNYKSSIIVNYKGDIYPFPFNMWTYNKIWGVKTYKEAEIKIFNSLLKIDNPTNFEEYALSKVGEDLYNIFIKGYTTKQWGKDPKLLPSDIFKRLPVRNVFQNNYYSDAMYEGIPVQGYTPIFDKLLDKCDLSLNTLFDHTFENMAQRVIYTGCIDEYYNYCFGKLEYRSLRFEQTTLAISDFQSNAIVNYTDSDIPYTRIIEHKHFNNMVSDTTVITKEYPMQYGEPYYPISDSRNRELYREYLKITNPKVEFGGRLGSYKYLNMDQTIEAALEACAKWI